MSQIWDTESVKPAVFHHAARVALQGFPPEVRRTVGKAIWELQQGIFLSLPLSRPMPAVTAGTHELRVKDRSGAYRVFYLAKREDAVLIFHAFTKKSQKTPQNEIELGRKRLKELINEQA